MSIVQRIESTETPCVSGAWTLPTPDAACSITIMLSTRNLLTKTIRPEGTVLAAEMGKLFDFASKPIAGLDDIRDLLNGLQHYPTMAVLRGEPIGGPLHNVRRLKYVKDGDSPTIRDVPRRWLALDVDGIPLPAGVAPHDLAGCAKAAIAALPPAFRSARVVVQATGSHGIKPGARLRLWYWLSRSLWGDECKAWLKDFPVDKSVFDCIEPIFTAPPHFADGRPEPIPQRIIELPGAECVAAPSFGEAHDMAMTARDAAEHGPAPELAELAAPSVGALVRLLQAMPNPPQTDHELRVRIGKALAGARAGLLARLTAAGNTLAILDDDSITDAWCSWVGKQQRADGRPVWSEEAIREKWQGDLCRIYTNHRAGWHSLMAHASGLGTDPALLSGFAADSAAEQFEAEPMPAGIGIVARTKAAVQETYFLLRDNGPGAGWYHGGGAEMGKPLALCDPFAVLGRTENLGGSGGGLIIRFAGADGQPRDLLVPARVIHSGGQGLAGYLGESGLPCLATREAHSRLAELVSLFTRESLPLIRTVDRAGWHDVAGETVFLLPDGSTYGRGGTDGNTALRRLVLRQGDALGGMADDKIAARGTLAEWQGGVAAYAIGNSRAAFFLSAAFLAPLLSILRESSGGFHLVGGSSTGKSTLLAAAASVWGPGKSGAQIHQWRVTMNGLEALAAASCDRMLALDEISQAPAKDVADAIYALFNEGGKSTMTRTRTLRPAAAWRIAVLSTGEKSIAQRLAEAGDKAPPAGLAVRMVEIPADAGCGHGVFQRLHGLADGGALARHLGESAVTTCGTGGRAYLANLARLIGDPASRDALVQAVQRDRAAFIAAHMQGGAKPDRGQVERVAHRFASAAAAGELATRLGVLPWPFGTAIAAAGECFTAWLEGRGGSGAAEDMDVVRRARLFLEANGSSRFADLRPTTTESRDTGFVADLGAGPGAVGGDVAYADSPLRIINRAGWRMAGANGVTEFAILPETFKAEICRGGDPAKGARALADAGYLKRGDIKNWTKQMRVPEYGTKPIRCYVISGEILGG